MAAAMPTPRDIAESSPPWCSLIEFRVLKRMANHQLKQLRERLDMLTGSVDLLRGSVESTFELVWGAIMFLNDMGQRQDRRIARLEAAAGDERLSEIERRLMELGV